MTYLIILGMIIWAYLDTNNITIALLWTGAIVLAAKNHPLIGKNGYFSKK